MVRSIMLVEDDNDDEELFCLTIKDMFPEIECLCFTNGKEALQYLKTTDKYPDIIFTDLAMHYVDGSEFVHSLKKDNLTENIPVYIYSTPFLISKIESEVRQVVSGYLLKTNDYKAMEDELISILRNAMVH